MASYGQLGSRRGQLSSATCRSVAHRATIPNMLLSSQSDFAQEFGILALYFILSSRKNILLKYILKSLLVDHLNMIED